VRWTFTTGNISGGTLTCRPSSSTASTNLSANTTYVLYGLGSNDNRFTATAGCVCSVSNVSIDYVNGILVRQAVAASRPSLQLDATTGYYYLDPDGLDDGFSSGMTQNVATNRFTGWFGVRKTSDAALGIIYMHGTSFAGNGLSVVGPTGATNDYGFATRGATTTAQRDADGISAPNSSILVARFFNSGAALADQVRARINGSDAALTDITGPTAAGNIANLAIQFLRNVSGGSDSFSGRCYGAFGEYGVDTALPTMQAGEQYLATRMGITLP
jgi:hypothetical protein